MKNILERLSLLVILPLVVLVISGAALTMAAIAPFYWLVTGRNLFDANVPQAVRDILPW